MADADGASTTPVDTKDGVKEEKGDYINLKVMSQDHTEVHFRIKRATQMKKLIEVYCQRQGLDNKSVRFMFDGERVKDSDTPATLDMDDNDVIDVMQEQTGGQY